MGKKCISRVPVIGKIVYDTAAMDVSSTLSQAFLKQTKSGLCASCSLHMVGQVLGTIVSQGLPSMPPAEELQLLVAGFGQAYDMDVTTTLLEETDPDTAPVERKH